METSAILSEFEIHERLAALDRKLELVARTERTIVDLHDRRLDQHQAFTASRVVHRESDRADPAYDLPALAAVRRPLSCTACQNGVLVCIARS